MSEVKLVTASTEYGSTRKWVRTTYLNQLARRNGSTNRTAHGWRFIFHVRREETTNANNLRMIYPSTFLNGYNERY